MFSKYISLLFLVLGKSSWVRGSGIFILTIIIYLHQYRKGDFQGSELDQDLGLYLHMKSSLNETNSHTDSDITEAE